MLAEVAEQADALRSGRSGLYAHVGSTPTFGTSSRPSFQAGIFDPLVLAAPEPV